MPASPEQAERKQRDREAAILLRRSGMSAAQVGEQLGRSARSIRDLTQGADLSAPPPEPEPDARKPGPKRKAARRRTPRQFRERNQNLGRMLQPFTVGGVGGFDDPDAIEYGEITAEQAGRPTRIVWVEDPGPPLRRWSYRV